jgi:hypothetical protein
MFEIQGGLLLILTIALFVTKGFALVDCVGRPADQFAAAETLPKRTWLILLVLALIAHLLWSEPLAILNLLGTLAALVYLAQMRGSSH